MAPSSYVLRPSDRHLRSIGILCTFMVFTASAQNPVGIGLYQGPSPDVLEVRVEPTNSFNLIVSSITLTIRWETSSGASLGAIDQDIDGNTCPMTTVPFTKSPDGEIDEAGFRYQTITSFGFSQLQSCNGYSWPGGQQSTLARIPIIGGTGCATFEIVNDSYTFANNKDYYISLGGEDSTGPILPSGVTYCAGASVSVSARAILDGAYLSGTGLMRDNLRSGGLIPNGHPYSGAPFNHGDGETLGAVVLNVTGNDAIVDWVLLELRDAGTPSIRIASRAALVQRDGDIVDTDGVSAVVFNGVSPGNYHLAVRHRNHLGIMTAGTFAFAAAPIAIDLTTAGTPTYGTNARRSVNGVMTMWGGNANVNTLVNYSGFNNDRQAILNLLGAATFLSPQAGYLSHDVTMNGLVSYSGFSNDRQFILTTLGAATFLLPRSQQLP